MLPRSLPQTQQQTDHPLLIGLNETGEAVLSQGELEYGVQYGGEAIVVDFDYIESTDYKEKFSGLTDRVEVNNALHNTVQTILEHCDGTEHEDLYLINADDGSICAKITETTRDRGIVYTDEFTERLRESAENGIPIIAIHNHPQGTPPSADDFRKAYENGYAFGIVAGHNGQLYMYETISKELAAAMDMDCYILSLRRGKLYGEGSQSCFWRV